MSLSYSTRDNNITDIITVVAVYQLITSIVPTYKVTQTQELGCLSAVHKSYVLIWVNTDCKKQMLNLLNTLLYESLIHIQL